MSNNKEFIYVPFVSAAMVVVIVLLWIQNNELQEKVNACAWQIDVANESIQDANDEISSAKSNAGNTYQVMEFTLQNLEGEYALRDNPCSKDFTGDLASYPQD